MKRLLKDCGAILLLMPCLIAAQSQAVKGLGEWGQDGAWEVMNTYDQGYAVAGQTFSFGTGGEGFLIKFDANMNVEWSRIYGTANTELPMGACCTADSGYAVAGMTGTYMNERIFLSTFDRNGIMQWLRTMKGDQYNRAKSVVQTHDKGYAVTGYYDVGTYAWLFIAKYDSSGVLEWAKTVEGANEGEDILQTQDHGYVIVGYTNYWMYTSGQDDGFIIKFDSTGTVEWARAFGGSDYERAYSVDETWDYGYVIVGMTRTFGPNPGSDNAFIAKFDAAGNYLWAQYMGLGANDEARAVTVTQDSGYAVVGYSDSYGAVGRMLLAKFDSQNNYQWGKVIGADYAYSVVQTPDSGYATCGFAANWPYDNMFIAKYESAGEICTGGSATPPPLVGPATCSVGVYMPVFTTISPDTTSPTFTVVDQVFPETLICMNDVTAPEPFDLLSPLDSTCFGDPRPTLVWETAYDMSGIDEYEVYINDTLRHTLGDTTWLVDYDLTESWHSWYIIAYDSLSNWRQSNQTWAVGCDTTPPVINNTTHWPDTSYTGPFAIATAVIDNLAGVDSVILWYQRDEDGTWQSSLMTESSGWYCDTIPQVTGSDDSVRYYVWASDRTEPQNTSTDPAGAPGNYHGFIAGYTGVEEYQDMPTSLSFSVSTPARSHAEFRISVPKACVLSLRMYDVAGRLVAIPLAGQYAAGYHDIAFTPQAKGVFFYWFESPYGDRVRSGKVIIF